MLQTRRAFAGLFALAALAAAPAAAEPVKVAMNGVEDLATNSEYAFVVAFRDSLAAAGIEVETFPSGSLGSEDERLAQTSQGLIHVNLAAVTAPASMSPAVRGFIMPFMFESAEAFDRVIAASDLLAHVNAPLLDQGLRLAAFNLRGLDAGIFNAKRPVATVADLEALRMRALDKGQVAFFEALGVRSTVVSWAEVSNALQTGVVDGYVNPPNAALRTGHTEFLKHYTPAALAPSFRAVIVSQDWWDLQPPETQAALEAAIAAGVAANRAWVADWAGQVDARFAEAGVTVTDLAPGERAEMQARAAKVWESVMSAEDLAAFRAAIDAAGG
jgi:TRAP-type C4-dicarboxylate transport system substrate-binding protein